MATMEDVFETVKQALLKKNLPKNGELIEGTKLLINDLELQKEAEGTDSLIIDQLITKIKSKDFQRFLASGEIEIWEGQEIMEKAGVWNNLKQNIKDGKYDA